MKKSFKGTGASARYNPLKPVKSVKVPISWRLDPVETALAEKSLKHYIRQAWHVIEPKTPFVDGWHIDAMCEHLEAVTANQIKRLLINVPPRHMKSITASVMWPSWEWGPKNQPNTRWLFGSYANSLSMRDSVKCRRIVQSNWYLARWGHVFQFSSDQNAKGRYETDQAGYRLATSIEGSATGEGGDKIVIDDPHNVKKAESETVRQSVLDWLDVVMSTRLNDPKESAVVMIMQRVHADDASGHVLAQGGWTHLCLPAEYEDNRKCIVEITGWEDPREEDGELLWPDRFGDNEIAKQKVVMGSYAYAGQFQQRPSPREGGIVKRSWWRFCKMKDRPKAFDEIIGSWDMSFKKKKHSDFVAGHIWGRVGADKYLLDRVHERMGFVETKAIVKVMAKKWPDVKRHYIEDKANGTAIIDELKTVLSGLIPVNPTESKEARAEAVAPQIESGNVYLPDPLEYPWVGEYLDEWEVFPNGPHDDDVDATTQALTKLEKRARHNIPPVHSQTKSSAWRSMDLPAAAAGTPATEPSSSSRIAPVWSGGW